MEGLRLAAVSEWLTANVTGAVAPLRAELIAGGHSNLTYSVAGADGRRFVLRRPPLGHVLATAHDMGREYRIIAALNDTPVPVAPALGFCDDPAVNDAPFYVMGFVDGHVVRDASTARAALDASARRAASEHLVDVLAAIHAVDVDAVGLGDLGRRDGYVERQLKRWSTQWERSKTRDLPEIDEVHRRLAATVPEQGPATIVHGDYRLDNCILGTDGAVRAVLDWELCTLGDPLADVGLLLVYWGNGGGLADPNAAGPTSVEGFLNRDSLLARYAAASGRDLSHIAFYVAFANWKLACIVEGVYARYVAGAMGAERGADHEVFRHTVEVSARAALEATEQAR